MRNSSEATRFVTSGGAKDSAFNLRLLSSFLLCTVCFFICPTSALAQDSSQQSPATTPAAQSEIKQNTTEVKQNSTELAAHDEPTTFKVNVRLVLVRSRPRLPRTCGGKSSERGFSSLRQRQAASDQPVRGRAAWNSDCEGSTNGGRKYRRCFSRRHTLKCWTHAGCARAFYRLPVR